MAAIPLEHASLHEKQLNLSVLQDAPLHIWEVPSAVTLRESKLFIPQLMQKMSQLWPRCLKRRVDPRDVTAASICVLASTRNPPFNFVSYKSQVTAFPKLLLPNHITVLASTTVDLYFLHNFHLDSSEFV